MFSDFFESLQRPDIQPKKWMKDVELILGTKDNIVQAVDECLASEYYGIDLETTGLDLRVFDGRTRCSIVGISIAPNEKKSYYFPIRHTEGAEHNVGWSIIQEQFNRLLDPNQKAIPVFHNASFDQEFLVFNGGELLGKERFDNPRSWEDNYILISLIDPRDKGGRGLKTLSKEKLGWEMIELSELMPSTKIKDYATLNPSWKPSVWYACSDALCTLRIFHILIKEFPKEMQNLYMIEKKCATSVRWMHRNRVFIDKEKTTSFVKKGQIEWIASVVEVYKGASDILGRDVTPSYIKIMTGELKGLNKFNPDSTESYKDCIEQARLEADRLYPDIYPPFVKQVNSLTDPKQTESVNFPFVYDIFSPQQLGLLFRELGVPNIQTTEKGQVATGAEVLDEVIENAEDSFPFMKKIKRFRELAKALGQYLIPMLEDVAEDGTLKAKFNQFGADTGRFSCGTTSKPWEVKDGGCRVPFQGIPSGYDPKRPEISYRTRECISVRNPDHYIVAIDYAGVELRIVTNLSQEPLWIEEFFRCSSCDRKYPKEMDEQGFIKAPPSICICGSDKIGDLHTLTAVAFYGEDAKKRPDWKALRGNAKGVNFALCYGGTGKAVVRTINCTQEEGDEKYQTFTKTYKGLTGWWKKEQDFAKSKGFVKTAFGRQMPMPDIKAKEFWLRSKDERKAVNSPVQGTSADITKIAMSLIYENVKKRNWFDKLMMILTVHDEIVFEIHKDIIGEAIPMLCNLMVRNKAIQKLGWQVPLTVDVEIGKDWSVPYDLKELRDGHGGDEFLINTFKVVEKEKIEDPLKDSVEKEDENAIVYEIKELNENNAEDLVHFILNNKGQPLKILYQGVDRTILLKDILN